MNTQIYKCTCCNYNSNRLYNFKRHQKFVHKIENENLNIIEKSNVNQNENLNLNIIEKSNNNIQYIYLFREREFIKTNENIYKIGKTKQENLKRLSNYPTGTQLLYQSSCNNCDYLERILIEKFKKYFQHMNEIGNEYFRGNVNDMIYVIIANQMKYDNRCKINKDIINDFTNNNDENYKCYNCNKSLSTHQHLHNHLKNNLLNEIIDVLYNVNDYIVDNDKNYKCYICNKQLSTKTNLNKHLLICKGVLNPLECHICHKVFSDSSSKSRHLKKCKNKYLNEN